MLDQTETNFSFVGLKQKVNCQQYTGVKS